MKKIKFICLSFIFILFSCNDNDQNNSDDLTQSSATRIYLNAVKEFDAASNLNSSPPSTLCLTPVFPIEVNFSNGLKVVINSMEGLKEAMYAEHSEFHINNFVFPFSVFLSSTNEQILVADEVQFSNLLSSCPTIRTVDQYFTSSTCFGFIFPLTVINNSGETITILNSESLLTTLNSLSENDYWSDFVYPFKINYGGNEILIQSVWDFYNYVDCTPEFGCICNLDINPVCVQTPNGVIRFDNLCWAQCAGYTSQDIISCD
jgi:hypothetical protein